MRNCRLDLVCLPLILLSAMSVISEASVTATPASFSIPSGQFSSKLAAYQFIGAPGINGTLTSASGTFLANGDMIDSNIVTVTMDVRNGSGRASENIQIPVKVLERVLRKGKNRFTYVRNFTGPGMGAFPVTVSFLITTEAAADFDIKRVELYFENKRPEIAIGRGAPLLKAFADVRFVGSGLLRGHWEVDGRIITQINQHVAGPGSVTVQTFEMPSLPTFSPGTHSVRLVITSPKVAAPLPTILYFVVPDGVSCSLTEINVLSPSDNAEMDYAPFKITWDRPGKTTMFFVSFYQTPGDKPLFSAYTKDKSYTIPDQVLRSIFQRGAKYYWRIFGYDEKNIVICDQRPRSFTFKK